MEATPLGQRLRLLRKAVKLTPGEAAERIGVDRSTLHRWESGDLLPRLNQLAEIGDAYGVPPGRILTGFTSDDLRQSTPQPG